MSRRKKPAPPSDESRTQTALRIVGGSLRGRKLLYSGDERTRPMKDRVREAVFNLIGPDVEGLHAIDLFAGTGALGLEALSRGAARATFVEQHFPTADVIRQNIDQLDLGEVSQVQAANTFIWARRLPELGGVPWLVFCSPPYAFYHERADEMLELVAIFAERSPPGSILVVEADMDFDFSRLPQAGAWHVRGYPPAVVGIYRKPAAAN